MPKFDDVPKVHAEVDRSLVRAQAVAWAWYQHGGGSRGHGNPSEAGAVRSVMKKFAPRQPSRFKVEAELWKTSGRSSVEQEGRLHSLDETGYPSSISNENRSLELKSSLFDSFDLLSISKQLDESVRRKTTTSQGPERPESRSGGTAMPRVVGSKTAKRSPFQDSRRDRALFQFRIRGSLCRSAEIVSCQAAGRRVQVEKQSSLTVAHTKPNANEAPLFKRCSSVRASNKQTRYAQSITEENQESRDRKKEKFLHLMSFNDVSKVLQQVNHLPQSHSDHHQRSEHHHHHLHHHHHHYVQFHEKQLDRIYGSE